VRGVRVVVPLLARFPRLRAPAVSRPVIPESRRPAYPELAADFAVLDRVVASAFTEADLAALRDQNRYRRQQVLILFGSALVTGLGGLQAVFPSQRWPGLLLASLGVVLAGSTHFAREEAAQADYLSARVKAERFRALHFRYLSATGPYAGPDRETALRHAVVAIKAGKEPQ
jgi:SMODS and SLOG-associating 2TM effector domain 3